MIESQQYKIGFFVLGGIIIGLVALFLVGLSQIFEPTLSIITCFDESVQGLETGSPVKLRGVPIGKVSSIKMNPRGDLISVELKFNIRVFNATNEQFDAYQHFKSEVNRGLRCQLEFLGITGLKYIELDYQDPKLAKNTLPQPVDISYNQVYIPSYRSLVSGLKTSVVELIAGAQTAINNFNRIEFDRFNTITEESTLAIQEARKFITQRTDKIDNFLHSVETAANEIKNVAAQVKAYTDTQRVEPILADIQSFSSETKFLVADIRQNLAALNLPQRADRLDTTMMSIDDAAVSFIQLQDDIKQLFENSEQTMMRLNALLKLLEEHPSSIIYGQKGKTYLPDPKEKK